MKIVVAVDSSEFSKLAIKHLSMSGLAMDARVRFVHVMKKGQKATDVAASLSKVTSILTDAQAVETLYVEGNPADEILEMASDWGAELIAVGTSDKRGIERLLMGSVSKTILSKACCPVVILRGKPAAINNVLATADDTESSAACLEWFSKQIWARSKGLALLSVMHDLPHSFDSEFKSVESASAMLLRKQVE